MAERLRDASGAWLQPRLQGRGEVVPRLHHDSDVGVVDPAGGQVRYADGLVVTCTTKAAFEQAEARSLVILERLGLEPDFERTRRVNLYPARKASSSSAATWTADDPRDRITAAAALAGHGVAAEPEPDALICALPSQDERLRGEAVTALGVVGIPRADVVQRLSMLAAGTDQEIARRAQSALRTLERVKQERGRSVEGPEAVSDVARLLAVSLALGGCEAAAQVDDLGEAVARLAAAVRASLARRDRR